MSAPYDQLAAQIHAHPRPLVLAVTGGGSQAIATLLQQPGASRTVLEAIVPYANAALIDFLGAQPEQFCSPRTARVMAMAAWQRARRLSTDDPNIPLESLVGIGCTASLASDRPKRGAHRAHVALQTSVQTATWSIEFDGERRSRSDEESLAAGLVLNALAEACQLAIRMELKLLDGERLEHSSCNAPASWQELLLGRRCAVRSPEAPPGQLASRRAIFPGSFNPLHDGHRQMSEVAARRLGSPVEYEISVSNVDKPPLDYEEMRGRAAQFNNDSPLWFTAAPTFVEKSALFPGATFVVGADTIVRIADPRYYGGSSGRCGEAIDSITAHGCRFLVFAREMGNRLKSLSELALPPELERLCDEVPPGQFQNDLSSTALRQQR